jgi:hypothetical protein
MRNTVDGRKFALGAIQKNNGWQFVNSILSQTHFMSLSKQDLFSESGARPKYKAL